MFRLTIYHQSYFKRQIIFFIFKSYKESVLIRLAHMNAPVRKEWAVRVQKKSLVSKPSRARKTKS